MLDRIKASEPQPMDEILSKIKLECENPFSVVYDEDDRNLMAIGGMKNNIMLNLKNNSIAYKGESNSGWNFNILHYKGYLISFTNNSNSNGTITRLSDLATRDLPLSRCGTAANSLADFTPGMHVVRHKDRFAMLVQDKSLVEVRLDRCVGRLFDSKADADKRVHDYFETVDNDVCAFEYDAAGNDLVHINALGEVRWCKKKSRNTVFKPEEESYYHCIAAYDGLVVIGYLPKTESNIGNENRTKSSLALLNQKGKLVNTTSEFSKGTIKYVSIFQVSQLLIVANFMSYDYFSIHAISKNALHKVCAQIQSFESKGNSVYSFQIINRNDRSAQISVSGYPCFVNRITVKA